MFNPINYLKTFIVIIGVTLFFNQESFSQAVSINATGTAPNAESILDVTSTTKGVLLPRFTTAQRTAFTPTVSGMTVYDTTTESYWYWDDSANVWREIPNTENVSGTLDEAYDGNGIGAGRSITGDAGSVQIVGTSGSVALETDGDIQLAEDQWIGLGVSLERIEFDGSLNRVDVEGADVTLDSDKWIGIDASSPRIEFEDVGGRLNMQDADIELDDAKWIGINASNPRVLFEGGTTDKISLEDADVQIDNNKWFGLGSSIERFEFQGSDDEVNLMGAQFGIGTLAPTTELDVNGQIRMRTGATVGYVPVGDANGVMTWTDPATFSSVSTASNGLTAVSDDIQLGGSLTQNTTITQGAFTLDFTTTATDGFSIDGTTFSVDAANNRIGVGTDAPATNLEIDSETNGFNVPLLVRNTAANTNGDVVGIGLVNEQVDYGNFYKAAMVHERTAGFGVGKLHFLVDDGADGNSATLSESRMTILPNGNVGIGATNPSVKLQVAGDATISGKFNSNGIQESSDRRFKKDISPLENALENVLKIEGVTYNWRVDEFPAKNFSDRTEIGVIAQDLEKVYPELVSTDAEGYKSVQYSHLVPVLLEAIKQQQLQIESLNQNVEQLSNLVDVSTSECNELKAKFAVFSAEISKLNVQTKSDEEREADEKAMKEKMSKTGASSSVK